MIFSPRRLLLQFAAAVTLLAIGFSVGRFSSSVRPVAISPVVATSPQLSETTANPSNVFDHAGTNAVEEWNHTWAQLSVRPRSPAADAATGSALQKLAASDPTRALALALQEKNRYRRTAWLHAVLRGWATVAPLDAAAWLANLSSLEREGAEAAVMEGAANETAAAIDLAQRLMQSDPTGARSHAGQLLRVLNRDGEYEAGVDFASRLPDSIRAEMLGTAFQYWAEAQPERALDAALKFPTGDTRKTALDAAISGWAQGDPAGLAEHALKLPSTEDRTEALQTAIREWVSLNPKAASDWVDRFDPKPELDAGAAAVALQPDIISRQPEIAASWAESITEAKLRSTTLAQVLREWSAKDRVAALNYAKNSSMLDPADRATLLNELVTPSL